MDLETGQEIADIRTNLWQLLSELKAGDIDVDVVEQSVNILDSLLDASRLEQALEQVDEPDEASERHRTRGGGWGR